MKKLIMALVICISMFSIVGCGSATIDDTDNQQEKLSKDDAEVLIYQQLSSEEQNEYTIDFTEEKDNKYYIRVYKMVDGNIEVKSEYTVNYLTQEVEKIK
ncbi:hypothetical protein CIB95_01190 [Lottiidibacillus patelloidae]|uniref:PepSY domain-containing protein n=1 Tax=Lottiidibacillus patelloidae TaxID=2670334 RepID=A0A263BY29_9BACI|nr:hypothetical protein [Lottiidibacillus patelloidae]OZM58217.1 hypothetical protein CIB95_01190 [Lottiidibacillus patelloidae]